MRRLFPLLFLLLLLVVGCQPDPYYDDDFVELPPDYEWPTITVTTSPSDPDAGEPFGLKVTGESAEGIVRLYWEWPYGFGEYDCGVESECTHSWQLQTYEVGEVEIVAWAEDVWGEESSRVTMEVDVQEVTGSNAGGVVSPPSSLSVDPVPVSVSSAACGNYDCEIMDGENFENCPEDCIELPFTCGNDRCEIGESFLNCGKDCVPADGDRSRCGNEDCEVGESNENCEEDCPPLEPDCGNGECEFWESATDCPQDCTTDVADDDPDGLEMIVDYRCSSDSDCGYKQKCKSGLCQTVDCTTDSHCSGCKRCSGNRCVSCGSGPYGCYC